MGFSTKANSTNVQTYTDVLVVTVPHTSTESHPRLLNDARVSTKFIYRCAIILPHVIMALQSLLTRGRT